MNLNPMQLFGVGGYSSFPVLRLCSVEGNSNVLFMRVIRSQVKVNMHVRKEGNENIFVATDGMEKFFPKNKV